MATESMEDNWISIAERLPDKDQRYLVYTKRRGAIQVIAGFVTFNKTWISRGENITAMVSHWQPLPAPPQTVKQQ